ncbi:hypothetical protein Mal52_29280 [Symmachiella dynata]|uniref:Uncharacterized protein n=1 Tax=Symmachiella dynata TaxID=2527995 RepID=A0A517ZPN3_9PLAN|nr:hypothetical protein [Symmachiella dynata]QDU44446.1 hypothetical protein Mal52_29280 [Symmachiella dynata]
MFRRFFKSLKPKPPDTNDAGSNSDQATRDWVRRIGILNGILCGLTIALVGNLIIRDRMPHDSYWRSASGFLLGYALLSIPSITLGIYLLLKVSKWLLLGSRNFKPPPEIPVSEFRTILNCLDAAAICCVGGSFLYRLFPIVPQFVYAIAMTFSICFSAGVLLLGGWATVLQPNRYHFVHIVLGLALVAATAYLWMTFFQFQ